MKLEIYTDGSATTADKPGGWAFVAVLDGKELVRESGHLPSATNNVAELQAAISGLAWYGNAKNSGSPDVSQVTAVELVADSQLVLKYATGEYRCKAMHLTPLYIKLRKLYGEAKASTRWVRGHAGDHYNEVCDKLAKAARTSMEA